MDYCILIRIDSVRMEKEKNKLLWIILLNVVYFHQTEAQTDSSAQS